MGLQLSQSGDWKEGLKAARRCGVIGPTYYPKRDITNTSSISEIRIGQGNPDYHELGCDRISALYHAEIDTL